MLVYYILLGVPLLLKVVSLTRPENSLLVPERKFISEKKITAVFFTILFLLLALRSNNIGVDLPNYEFLYNRIKSIKWSDLSEYNIEYGYAVFNKVISSVYDNFQFFLAVTALVTVLPLAILYCKESENAILSTSLFINMSVFVMLFSGLRQAIAIALSVPAYYCVKNKKLILFLLCILIAFSFHRSAFVLILLYPVYHAKISKNSMFLIFPIMAIVFIYRQKIFEFLLKYFDDYYSRYSGQENTGAYTMLILFILFIVYTFILTDKQNSEKDVIKLRNILLLAVCIQFFASVNSVAMRMNYYFIPFIPILISKMYYNCKPVDRQIVPIANTVMIFFFYIYFFYNAYNGADILNIFPYEFFWR